MEMISYDRVEVECYHCGNVFDIDIEIFIRAISLECPECKGGMAKHPN